MPLYEYYCEDCNGLFELLRPAREAADPQPCPECDADAPRIVSNFEAFTFREGYTRRLPDDGTYLHLGKKVSSKNKGGAPPHEHPELWRKKHAPDAPPTAEEMDSYAARELAYREQQQEAIDSGLNPTQESELEEDFNAFRKRMRRTVGEAKLKRRSDPNVKRTARTVSGKHGRTSKKE